MYNTPARKINFEIYSNKFINLTEVIPFNPFRYKYLSYAQNSKIIH